MLDVRAVTVVIGILLICFIIIGSAIANYILVSLGLYKIAVRRQISNSWMAWIPIGSDWIIGSLAGDYDKQKGIKRPWQTVLLTLSLIGVGAYVVVEVVMYVGFYILAFAGIAVSNYGTVSEESVAVILILFMFGMFILLFLVGIMNAATILCRAMCYFKIFESTVPEKALKYTLLYYMVPLAGGICLLKCKDKGYPEPQVILQPQEETLYSEPVPETEAGE